MRAAVTDSNNLVVNVVIIDADSDYDPGEGLTIVVIDDDAPCGLGWTHNGDGTWTEPTPAAPAAPPPSTDALLQQQIDFLTDRLMEQELL